VGEQRGDILFSGARPTQGFLKRYTGAMPSIPRGYSGKCLGQALSCIILSMHGIPDSAEQ
jgi:hypothetical protein